MSKHISKERVQELNEKYGWFQFGDAQSDVSNAFANEAIEKYERIRSSASDLLEALVIAEKMLCEQENAMRSLGVYDPCPEPAILTARAAIAKAT